MKFKRKHRARSIALKYFTCLQTHLLQKVNFSKSIEITTFAKYFAGIDFEKC